jgi:SOS-response transcriptional repressor LexA
MESKEFIQNRLESLRAARGATITSIHNALKINRYTLQKLFRGDVESTRDKALLRALIEHLGLTEEQFFNSDSLWPARSIQVRQQTGDTHQKVPIYGDIPAGNPIPMEGRTNPDEWIDAPPGLKCRNAFALRVRGQSMYPRFLAGDLVFFEPLDIRLGIKDPQNPVPSLTFERLNGRVVAALVDNEATLKQLKVVGAGDNYQLELRPFNSDYAPLRIKPEHTVIFQGVVVQTLRNEYGDR